MEPAIVLSISITALLIAITGYGIYVSFGPPSKQLRDPFDEHED
jgi:PsbN protein